MPPSADRPVQPEMSLPVDREVDVLVRRMIRRRVRVMRAIVLAVTFLMILGLVSPLFYWRPDEAPLGQPVKRNIRAQFNMKVKNQQATERKKDEVRRSFKSIYLYDSRVLDRAKENLTGLIAAAAEAASREYPPSLPASEMQRMRLNAVRKRAAELGVSEPPDKTLESLLRLARDESLAKAGADLLEDVYVKHGVVRDKITFAAQAARGALTMESVKAAPFYAQLDPDRTLDLSEQLGGYVRSRSPVYLPPAPAGGGEPSSLLEDLVLAVAREPNIVYRLEETRQQREKAVTAVEPVFDVFSRGDLLAPEGTVATERDVELVEGMNRQAFNCQMIRVLANAVITFLALWFIVFCLRKFHPEMGLTAPNLWLVLLPILTALAVGRLALEFVPDPYQEAAPYLFPAGLAGILGLILVEARMAIVMVVIASLLFGLAADLRLEYAITAVAGGLAGVAGLYRMRERRQFVAAGAFISLVTVACVGAFAYLMDPARFPLENSRDFAPLAAGLLNGFVCIALVYYAPIFFERYFGVATDMRLLELTARHDLLLRMEREAPGTYQHSLNVAKLAEAAADAIGANFLLVRAGAYFHDVGKIPKREYFTENQVTPEETNIHKKLTPNMSTLLIKNHVKEGIEMARKAGLPPSVIDFIPMHHGTMLIAYFYNLAVLQYENSQSKDPVVEDEFRYPGPKPQTRETAILMMADGVEATAHSVLTGRTVDVDEIRQLVNESVRTRFNDGQFDECHLTLRDLHLISESFVQTLRARYHRRVAYKKA